VNGSKELIVRALLAAAGGTLLSVLALQSAYAQTKADGPQKIPELHRALPLTKFYDTPDPLPHGKPGDLIRSEEFEEYDLPPEVLAVRILYHSRSASGQDVAASGVVLYPDGKAPAGGWPLIAWAHALNGVARQCAPSLERNLRHGPFLSMYVGLGYAVVATDYAGLGTTFRNAFSDMRSNAADVIYSVPAARAAVPQLNSRWIAIGIGEGGPAVVGIAELEGEIRDPGYLGSIVISGLDEPQGRYESSVAPTYYEMPLFLAYGIKTVYPQFDVKDILTDKGVALYPRVEQSYTEPTAEANHSPAEMLKPNWASNTFVRQYFARNTLGQKPAKSPMLVISSELDASVPINRTAHVIARMCKQGDRIQFERYPQSEASRVFGDSVGDQISWIQARFANRPAASNCAEQR
jgi:Secretory lipase